jgi:hypothetical protein
MMLCPMATSKLNLRICAPAPLCMLGMTTAFAHSSLAVANHHKTESALLLSLRCCRRPRGNIGLDVAPEKMALVQKQLISNCNLLGKPVLITRVVDSMVTNPRPTRAEATGTDRPQLLAAHTAPAAAACTHRHSSCSNASFTCDSTVVMRA